MKITQKQLIAGLFVSLLVFTAAVFLLVGNRQSSTPVPQQTPRDADAPKTIGSEWQWEALNNRQSNTASSPTAPEPGTADEEQEASTVAFDVAGIYEELQSVQLDEDGNVVVDEQALRALEDTFKDGDLELTEADLEELQELIRIGLPGPAGEQTAEVVGQYYRYLGAEEELAELYSQADSPDEIRAQYNELATLRETYFGPELANQLYGEREQTTRYMLEMMLLERDNELSEEEKEARREELTERFQPDQPSIDNWQDRYQRYQAQKNNIENAGLSDSEKERQVEQLLNNSFSASEQRQAAEKGLLPEANVE